MIEGTVDLTKVYAQPAATVFAAWASEQAQRVWGDPGEGWDLTFEVFRFAVGETDICRFGPTGGRQYINEIRYLAIEPAKRIVYSSSLGSQARLTFAGTVAATFEPVQGGTRLRLLEQGLYFDGLDDLEGHRSGWQGMLEQLAAYLGRT